MASYIVNAYNNGGSGGSVNMRSGPAMTYGIVVRVPHGETVTGTKSGEWSYMTYKNYSGYMMSVFLDDAGTTTPGGTWVTRWTNTPGETVNIRSGAGTNYSIVTRLSHGTKVEVNTPTATWSQIRRYGSTSILGYIMTEFLTNTDPNGSSGGSTGGGTTSNGLQAGHYVQVSSSYNTVNVRASASTTSTLRGVLFAGTKVYCSAVVNDSWVKIIWGGMGSSDAYIKAQYLEDGDVAPASKRDRAIAIANSMTAGNYPYKGLIGNMGLDSNKWCVQYCSWLMKAAGCSSSNYVPFADALVSEAVTFFQKKGKFGLRANKVPTEGDWVFFSQGSETYQHVGLVVDVSGTNITTVEGNLDGKIASRGPSSYYGSFGSMTVYGFATPTWA